MNKETAVINTLERVTVPLHMKHLPVFETRQRRETSADNRRGSKKAT